MGHEFVIVRQSFSEAEAGVENDVFGAQVAQLLQPPGEKLEHIRCDVGICRLCLHVLRRPLHVHQNVRDSQLRHGAGYARVHVSAGDIVDNVSAEIFYAAAGYAGTERVYGENGVGGFPPCDGYAAAQALRFFLFRDVVCARSRRVAANVDDAASFFYDLAAPACNGFVCHGPAVCVERIGCDVQNAHDLG